MLNKYNHKKSTCDTQEISIDYLCKRKIAIVFEIQNFGKNELWFQGVKKNYSNGKVYLLDTEMEHYAVLQQFKKLPEFPLVNNLQAF